MFIGGTDAEAEAPILWPPDAKSQLIGKDPDAGKDEGRRRRGKPRTRWLDGITDSMDMSPLRSSVPSFLYSPTLTSIHDYWKNHSFDYMDLCFQSDVSVFFFFFFFFFNVCSIILFI